jgi:Abnormal spindle-like microcephaly-assoc'd, ASPM-SPD-2-Hydin
MLGAGDSVTDPVSGVTITTTDVSTLGATVQVDVPAGTTATPGSSSLGFGSVAVGQVGSAQTDTVTVNGPGMVSFSPSGSMTGSNPTDFRVTLNSCAGRAMTGGQTCVITIAYAPLTHHSSSAEFQLGTGVGALSIDLTGTGVAGTVTLSASSLDFGTVDANGGSSTSTLTLTNTGDAALTVAGTTIGGLTAGAWTKTADACTGRSVAVAASCSVDLRFAPATGGAKSGTLAITTNGTVHSMSIPLTGSASAPIVSVGTNLPFARTTVGSPTTQAVHVANTGSAVLSLSHFELGEANAAAFSITSNGCTTPVAVGDACEIDVQFAPVLPGTKTATLSMTSNISGVAPVVISLNGPAVAPMATASAAAIAYPATVHDTRSAARVITITNTGSAVMTTGNVALGGANSGDFTVDADTCSSATLAVGAACQVTVTFAPTATGPKTASLSVPSDAANVSGASTVAPTGTGGAGIASLSASTLAWGSTTLRAGDSRTVTVTNVSDIGLSVGALTLSGATPQAWTLGANTCSSTTLAAGDSCQFALAFSAATAGARSAVATLATAAGPKLVTLSGTAVAPSMTLSATSLAWGSTATLSGDTRTLTLTDAGPGSLTLTTVTVGGMNPTAWTKQADGCSAQTLGSGATCQVVVAFTGAFPGARFGTLVIGAANAANGAVVNVPLTATATGPGTSFSAGSLAFGSINTGTSQAQQVTVTNNGPSQMFTNPVSVTGLNPAAFLITANTCSGGYVDSGATCQITVTFAPSVIGPKAASLIVPTNGSGGTTTVTLSGTATAPGSLPAPHLAWLPALWSLPSVWSSAAVQ